MPPIATKAYYRYKQIDKDGTFFYSNTVLLNRNAVIGKPTLKVIANPVNGSLKTSVLSHGNQLATISITDNTGRKLSLKQLQLVSGYNATELDIGIIANGYYYLSLYYQQSQLLVNPVRFLKQ